MTEISVAKLETEFVTETNQLQIKDRFSDQFSNRFRDRKNGL